MIAYLLALAIGIVAGLRTLTAPTAVSWAAYVGWLDLGSSRLAFMGYKWTPWILSVLAIGEFIADQMPTTPSRTVPIQFSARLISGALCGAALGTAIGSLMIGGILGVIGAVIGTLVGGAARGAMAARLGRDAPAAFIEDAVAVAAAFLIVRLF